MTGAEDVTWIDDTAAAREAAGVAATLSTGVTPSGVPFAELRLPITPTQSMKTMLTLLLQQFTAGVSGTSGSLLTKSVVVQSREEAGGALLLTFQNPGPVRLTEAQLTRLVRRFEVYLDYHAKQSKSAFQGLSRQFFAEFQRKLAACELLSLPKSAADERLASNAAVA